MLILGLIMKSGKDIMKQFGERFYRWQIRQAPLEKLHLDKKTFIFKQICLPLSKEIVNAF